MDYQKVYDKICRILIQYTSVNNANMFTISNSPDKGEIGIKKDGEVIAVLCLYGNVNKCVPAGIISGMHKKYPFMMLTAKTDGNHFSVFNHKDRKYYSYDFDGMMAALIHLIKTVILSKSQVATHPIITTLSGLSLFTGIDHYHYGDKDILVFDDHRTSLGIIFEADRLGLFGGQVPNLVTFDFHE